MIDKLQKNNKIRVIHHKSMLKKCKVRKKIIKNFDDWNHSLLSYAYLPRYNKKGSWDKLGSRLVELIEYEPNTEEYRHIHNNLVPSKKTRVITSAWSHELDASIIVDGVHRAIGIQKGLISFPVTWLEYYGDLVHHAFCVEFMNVILYHCKN